MDWLFFFGGEMNAGHGPFISHADDHPSSYALFLLQSINQLSNLVTRSLQQQEEMLQRFAGVVEQLDKRVTSLASLTVLVAQGGDGGERDAALRRLRELADAP
jgi:hypothetical protein